MEDFKLGAITINCYPFPYIKSKTCLAVSNLNDYGIVAACEGDIHSSIVMYAFCLITDNASLNSDIIIEDKKENYIVFSHCGAGPFSCAESYSDIDLEEHYEVKSGMAVYYPVKVGGKEATIINLVGMESTYRMAILTGKTLPTEKLIYHSNPLKIKFKTKVEDLIEAIGNEGFNHHWMVSYGDYPGMFFEKPKYTTGVEHLLINGKLSIEKGKNNNIKTGAIIKNIY